MKVLLLIWLGKFIHLVSRFLHFGAGFTWPGHILIKLDPHILTWFIKQLSTGVILIAGTNGKTTTAKMIDEIMKYCNFKTIRNESGANLLNGIVSTLNIKSNWLGRLDASWAIFEVDEATLPLVLREFTPKIVVILNLFRDQLDRYGEIDLIAEKWQKALKNLSSETTVILNADDPYLFFIGKNLKSRVLYFGLNDQNLFCKEKEHAADSIYCPDCGKKLNFEGFYFSHLGIWKCINCGYSRPQPTLSLWEDYPLPGVYNRYNTLAAVLTAKTVGIEEDKIKKGLTNFQPAFGRQEQFNIEGKNVRILLSKNPAGFNESLRTLKAFPEEQKTILLVLNDQIPDGQDVSWIWDVDYETIPNNYQLIISGERAYDLGLRIKYLLKIQNFNLKFKIVENLKKAIMVGLERIKPGETLYILPTYSAMLEIRKILKGKKIL